MAKLVRQIYAIADKLAAETGRSFTPDGHMGGSIGEVFAADMYGLKLLRQSEEVHDAKKGKKLIQIKATSGDRVALSSEPEHLIVLKIENGKATEIFNGPGRLAWKSTGKRQKNGQQVFIYLN